MAYMATSLDGYIADRKGSVDWLNAIPNPDQGDYGFSEFMQEVDSILMGSNTFRVVQSFGAWPYEKPVFVASRSMRSIPNGFTDRISLVAGALEAIFIEMEDQGYQSVYVDGGQLVQGCLEAGLLHEICITRIPILLGDGIPLFAKTEREIQLKHEKTEVLGIGLVKTRYTIIHTPNPQVDPTSPNLPDSTSA